MTSSLVHRMNCHRNMTGFFLHVLFDHPPLKHYVLKMFTFIKLELKTSFPDRFLIFFSD